MSGLELCMLGFILLNAILFATDDFLRGKFAPEKVFVGIQIVRSEGIDRIDDTISTGHLNIPDMKVAHAM